MDASRILPLTGVNDALALYQRYQEVEGFRNYVRSRLPLVLAICLLLVVVSVACTAALVAFMGTNALLALLAIILAPFVLFGSLLVEFFVFFSWLEGRAIASELGHRLNRAQNPVQKWLTRKTGADLGTLPRVPWLMVAIFVALPVLLLFKVAFKIALLLVVLMVAAPFLYAVLERRA